MTPVVKNPPAMRETQVRSLGGEDPLEGGHGNPLQYSCLENSHGQRFLAGYSPWGCKESDTTKLLSTAQPRSSFKPLLRTEHQGFMQFTSLLKAAGLDFDPSFLTSSYSILTPPTRFHCYWRQQHGYQVSGCFPEQRRFPTLPHHQNSPDLSLIDPNVARLT